MARPRVQTPVQSSAWVTPTHPSQVHALLRHVTVVTEAVFSVMVVMVLPAEMVVMQVVSETEGTAATASSVPWAQRDPAEQLRA